MKRLVRSIFVITVCSVIFLSHSAVANALEKPTVVYDGKQKEFTLKNIAGTDLFPLYKELIPGDDIEQTIVLKIKNPESTTSIYLSAECEEKVRNALAGTRIDVYSAGKLIVENKIVFNDILLGKYEKETTEELTAIIHIPTAYSNEISGQKNKIQWIFKAQEEPPNNNPQTGDDSNLMIYVFAIFATIAIMIRNLLLSRLKTLLLRNRN